MLKSQFLRLFSILTKEEVKAFGDFLNSPFFGAKNQSRQFFSLLHTTYPQWIDAYRQWKSVKDRNKKSHLEKHLHPYLNKEEVAVLLFPGQPYIDGKMRRVISECKKLLELFCLQLAPRADDPDDPLVETFQKDLDLLRLFLHRSEYGLFLEQMRKIRKREGFGFRDHQFFWRAFQLEEIHNDFRIRTGSRDDTYGMMVRQLDMFFILYKLRLFCAMHTRATILEKEYDYPMQEELISYVERQNFLKEPLIHIYYLILQLEKGENTQFHFYRVRDLLETQLGRISRDESRQLYLFIYNFLEREHRKPGKNMARESFELIQRVVENKVIYNEGGKIAIGYFNAIVRVACRAGELEWAEQFIWENEDLIAGKIAKEVFDFALLTLLFFQKEYSVILRELDRLDFRNARLQVRERVLRLKTLYELYSPEVDSPKADRSPEFFRLVGSLRRFIRNKRDLRPADKEHFTNFVNFAEKLGKRKYDRKPLPEGFVKQVIREKTAEEEWLLVKVGEGN